MTNKLPNQIIYYASIYINPSHIGKAENTVISILAVLSVFAFWFYEQGGGVMFWQLDMLRR